MNPEVAISVKNLTKTYRLFGHPGDRIKQFFSLGFKQYHQGFTALKDVSFEIKKGETIGIIGRNGSGKSTLLQLICGILKPTSGTVQVAGRISALLELGAGFNPEFTGRENVYFQGALMGFTQAQMAERFDDIAAFADIGEFIDQPVRTYSSGMFVRLSFAVATNMEPDILIVDEALSVGDAVFQHKSRQRIQKFTDNGGTLLFVSHDQSIVSAVCRRCVLLNAGELLHNAPPEETFARYNALVSAKRNEAASASVLPSGQMQITSGTGEASVVSLSLLDDHDVSRATIAVGTNITLALHVRVLSPIPRLVLGFTIRDRLGNVVFGTNTLSHKRSIEYPQPQSTYVFRYQLLAALGVGSYTISTALVSSNDRLTNNFECREPAFVFEVINQDHPHFGGCNWLAPQLSIELLP